MDLCKFEASLVYKESSRTGSKATEKPVSKNKAKKALLTLSRTPEVSKHEINERPYEIQGSYGYCIAQASLDLPILASQMLGL